MSRRRIRGLTVIKEGEITWPAPPLQGAGRRPNPGQARSRPPVSAQGTRHGKTMARASRCRPKPWPSCLPWDAWAVRSWWAPWRTGVVPVALHGVRAGLLRGLHGGVERHALAAHAADERDQRHQPRSSPSARWCRWRHRSMRPARPAGSPRHADSGAAQCVALVLTAINMFGGFARDASACWRCSANEEEDMKTMTSKPGHRRLHRR